MQVPSISELQDPADLIREHQPEIWRYLLYLGADESLAEDLLQETFLQVLRSPFVDCGYRARSAYLRRVARNLLLKARRQQTRLPVLYLADPDAVWETFAGDNGGEQFLDALRRCVDELAPRSRSALAGLYREGRTQDEIALDLGMTRNGVKSLLRRARKWLRHCVEVRCRG